MAITAMILTISIVVLPVHTFAEIADGTHQINYEMKEAGNDNTSIADGYFSKPATLTVENGVKHIQLTVTSSSMVKSLSAPSGPVKVVSEDKGNETRTVKFKVDDLSQPVNMEMHIVVPDLYDTTHTARAVFDVSGLETTESATNEEDSTDNGAAAADNNDSNKINNEKNGSGEAKAESNGSEKAEENGSGKAEENPPTGDDTPIALYVLLLLGASVGIFAVWKSRLARN